jgi:hypothetical protein
MSRAFNFEPSWKLSGQISPAVFVSIDSNFDEQILQSIAGDMPIGISQEGQRDAPGLAGSDSNIAGKSGDVGMRVIGLGNEALIQCGGTVNPGNLVKPDANGKAVSAAPGDIYGGVALQKGSSGVKIKVIVMRGKN